MSYDPQIVPVIMFHSVGLNESDWTFKYISEPLNNFENKMAALKKKNYHTIHWPELYDHMTGTKILPDNSIMLTFDDGYLDNWVYVFPIIKRYGIKITIYVNPEFVDTKNEIRPTLEDVWTGKMKRGDMKSVGFLSWHEMKAMLNSGLVDIQSHALTHTWYYSGPKLIDFHRPGLKDYPWLAWNIKPGEKPYYMQVDQSVYVKWGTPIYEHEKSLICRRYEPNPELIAELTSLVAREGGDSFFQKQDWKMKLTKHHEELLKKHNGGGVFESEIEYENRVYSELRESKEILARELNNKIEYICWPGGGYNDKVLDLARKAGYKSYTLASKDQSSLRNRPGTNPERIKRMGSSSRYQINGKHYGYTGAQFFLSAIERHKGSLLHKWYSRFLLLLAVIRGSITRRAL